MFKFLKDKIKQSISKITKRIDTEAPTEEVAAEEVKEQIKEEPKRKETPVYEETEVEEKKEETEKQGFFSRLKESFKRKGEVVQEEKEIIEEEKKVEEEAEEKEKIEAPFEKEVEEAVKEEVEKELEEERAEKEKEIEVIEKGEKHKKKEKSKIVEEEKPRKEEIKEEIKEVEEKYEELKEEVPVQIKKEELVEEEKSQPEPEKKGFFQKLKQTITTKKINEAQFEDIFYDLELALLENNVALEVIEKIKDDLKLGIVDKPLPRSRIEDIIENTLKDSIKGLFIKNRFDILGKLKENKKRPYVICFVGINGSGKTTTIAKIAHMLKNNGFSVILAAADTFRAAAIQQLQHHGDKLNVKVIKHDYGSDPAAVAFDAIKHASAKGSDVVLIDTAGRMHSNANLRDEMKKIIRVAKPDLKIFVGEAITGNDCVEQAKEFNNAIDIDGIILSKTDVDEKGGAAVSVSYVTKKPIIYIGTGQEYKDLKEFDDSIVMNSLGFD